MNKVFNISIDLIKELRKRTGVGVSKCKEALIQSKGSIELAIDNIRKCGLETIQKRSDSISRSGVIISKILDSKKIGFMIQINCETDFVARNQEFQEFANTAIITAINEKINDISILRSKLELYRVNLINKYNENINIHKFVVLSDDFVGCYIHNFKIGAIVAVNGYIVEKYVKHLAMHIVARNPKYISVNDIPDKVILRERKVQTDIAIRYNKSPEIIERIVSGRMIKFINEIVLLKQISIIDTDKTIGDILKECGMKVNAFIRFELGNDI